MADIVISIPAWLPKAVVWFAATCTCAALIATLWLDRRAAREAEEFLTEARGGPRHGR